MILIFLFQWFNVYQPDFQREKFPFLDTWIMSHVDKIQSSQIKFDLKFQSKYIIYIIKQRCSNFKVNNDYSLLEIVNSIWSNTIYKSIYIYILCIQSKFNINGKGSTIDFSSFFYNLRFLIPYSIWPPSILQIFE